MPYRLNPRNRREVQVKRKSRWAREKLHPTVAKAKKHVSALNINVHHPGKARRPKPRPKGKGKGRKR